ncbi:MAG: hypothetical protein R8G66_34735 [Cytophagales bacterium]|nr:hypothetical protein [Cytophagales bacterium]
MKAFFRTPFILPIFLLMACGSSEQAKEDKTDLYSDTEEIITIDKDANDELFAEVMEIHDEVMPEMGSIRKTRKALLDKLENTSDEAIGKVLQEQADKLDESHEAMMGWMRQFNPNQDEGVTDSAYNVYLVGQKQKMIEVRDLMVNSLKEGKALLGSGE